MREGCICARRRMRFKAAWRFRGEGEGVRSVQLQRVNNVRDLGGIPVGEGRVVRPGLLYRGAALAGASPADCDKLFGELGIRCVVDVRCGWEREAAPDVEAPGVENLHIPFYDKEKVGIEYTEPAEGTKVVGRDVACDPDRFYRSLANPLTAGQMRQAVNCLLANAMQGVPSYCHCSGGKDRAGITALLVLTVLGASREAILEDYLLTNISRDKQQREMFERFLRFADGNEELARALADAHRALPEHLQAFYEAVDEGYGSMECFVRDALGISDERRREIRERCTCLPDEPCECAALSEVEAF